MAAYNEEVLIRQKPGGPFPPVRLHRYLDHPDHRNKTELLNRLGRSVVRVTDDSEEDNGGSGFLAKFRLANNDEFYALVTNEHVINMNFVRTGSAFYIFSELCDDGELIQRNLSSNMVSLTFPITVRYEGDGPYLDVTVIELNDKLVNQIGKENFIPIDALQHNTRAVKGDKIFVLEYPSFKNAVPGTPRHLCISEGVVGNYLDGKWSHYVFKHMADTQFKASGSPVLRWDGTVCGVHRGGQEQDDARGNPDDFNVAATMDVLLERLQATRSQNP